MAGLIEYLAMGGHAPFIWGAYGIAAAVMGGLLFVSVRNLRRRERDLNAVERSGRGRRAR